jgi:hypothetical protein
LRLKTLSFAIPEDRPARQVLVRLDGQPVAASLQVAGTRALVTLSRELTVGRDQVLEVEL